MERQVVEEHSSSFKKSMHIVGVGLMLMIEKCFK